MVFPSPRECLKNISYYCIKRSEPSNKCLFNTIINLGSPDKISWAFPTFSVTSALQKQFLANMQIFNEESENRKERMES